MPKLMNPSWWPPADAGVFVQGDIGLDADPTDAHGMTGADGTTRDHMMRVKIGYDEHGVFIHGDHHRRYVAVDTRDVGTPYNETIGHPDC